MRHFFLNNSSSSDCFCKCFKTIAVVLIASVDDDDNDDSSDSLNI